MAIRRKLNDLIIVLKCIISGGQTGADEGGLIAAKQLGLFTGGFMPKGWRTLEGPKPQFKEQYGMKEHEYRNYAYRTFDNVKTSDGTVRFASNFFSPGEICTMKAIKKLEKPFIDIEISLEKFPIEKFKQWLNDKQIKILNVAGNSESTSPGIKDFVIQFLVKALS